MRAAREVGRGVPSVTKGPEKKVLCSSCRPYNKQTSSRSYAVLFFYRCDFASIRTLESRLPIQRLQDFELRLFGIIEIRRFRTFAFFAWFFQYLYNSRQWGEIKSGYGTSPGGVFEFASGVLDSNRTSKFDDALGSGGKRLRNPF